MNNDIQRIREALQFIPVGGHDERVRVAFMLKSELGDSGCELWDEWRDGRGDDEAQSVWRSASETGPLKIGTLIHEARERGWRDDGSYQKRTPAEIAERKRIDEERAAKEEAENVRILAGTARKAAAIWKAATEAKADNPYLKRKQVSPVATLREIDADAAAAILGYAPKFNGEALKGRLLVVPVKQGETLSTVELIDGDKRKAALAGRGTKIGGYWAAQRLPDGDGPEPLKFAEGVATTLSVKESDGALSIATLSAGNIPAVAAIMRKRYPTRPFMFCADLVKATGEPDPDAVEAGRLVGGKVALPDFGADRKPDQKDFNDMAVLCGLEAVKRAIEAAREPDKATLQTGKETAPAGEYASSVELLRASDITPEAVEWLWNGWLAAGKMHVLGGAPGTGKTTIAMALAATLTIAGRWPDGTRSPGGDVVIWSGEDDPADTLIPRLSLSGADLTRVYFISDVVEGKDRRAFDPAKDMESLRRTLEDVGDVRLLVVDPIVSAVAGDSHKNAEVRRSLQPLVDLAKDKGCALLGITHFSKGTGGREPVERLTGSLAFGALARVVLVAAKQQEDGEDGRSVRIFLRAKSNIGPDDGGFEYDLQQAELKTHPGIFSSSVLWGNALEGGARELLATADATSDDGEGGTLADAKSFLADLLADGPLSNKEIRSDADGAGYPWGSIRRAQKALGVEAFKDGMKGGWKWKLARRCTEDAEDAQTKRLSAFSAFGNSERLQHDHDDLVEVEI
jgi:putative DNA primase/helicase